MIAFSISVLVAAAIFVVVCWGYAIFGGQKAVRLRYEEIERKLNDLVKSKQSEIDQIKKAIGPYNASNIDIVATLRMRLSEIESAILLCQEFVLDDGRTIYASDMIAHIRCESRKLNRLITESERIDFLEGQIKSLTSELREMDNIKSALEYSRNDRSEQAERIKSQSAEIVRLREELLRVNKTLHRGDRMEMNKENP